jgi:hypothetical protein
MKGGGGKERMSSIYFHVAYSVCSWMLYRGFLVHLSKPAQYLVVLDFEQDIDARLGLSSLVDAFR